MLYFEQEGSLEVWRKLFLTFDLAVILTLFDSLRTATSSSTGYADNSV